MGVIQGEVCVPQEGEKISKKIKLNVTVVRSRE